MHGLPSGLKLLIYYHAVGGRASSDVLSMRYAIGSSADTTRSVTHLSNDKPCVPVKVLHGLAYRLSVTPES